MTQEQIALHVYEIKKSKDRTLKHAFTILCNLIDIYKEFVISEWCETYGN